MLQSNSQGQKQHTPEFENCIQNVMKQGHKKGSAFAICTTTFEKAQKPIFVGDSESQKLHLFSESIKVEGHRVSGIAIHPKRIFHPEEGVEHVYLREELENAAPTLIGKPFGVDHMYVLPPPNVITNAWYDPAENGVAFEGRVDEQIAEQIRNQVFKGLSIELNWLKPGGRVEFANGVVPRNFELTSVHLLRNFPPGDKDAYIKFWNAIMEQLVLGPPRTIDDRVRDLEDGMEGMRNMLEVINGKIDVLGRSSPPVAVPSSSGAPKLQVVIPIGETEGKLPGALGKVTELEGKPQGQQQPCDIVQLRKDLVEAQAKAADLTKDLAKVKEKFVRFVEAVKGTHPVLGVQRSWSLGPQKMIAEQLRMLREFVPEPPIQSLVVTVSTKDELGKAKKLEER